MGYHACYKNVYRIFHYSTQSAKECNILFSHRPSSNSQSHSHNITCIMYYEQIGNHPSKSSPIAINHPDQNTFTFWIEQVANTGSSVCGNKGFFSGAWCVYRIWGIKGIIVLFGCCGWWNRAHGIVWINSPEQKVHFVFKDTKSR